MGEIINQIELKKWNKVWYRNKARSYPQAWATEVEVFDFLYGLARMIKPENVLEIGTFEGDTAVAIGRALKDNSLGHLTTVDVKDFGQKSVVENAGLSNFVTCIIQDIVKYAAETQQSFDLIFIDDGHSYQEAIRDLEYSNRLIKDYGYIIGHDVLTVPDVTAAYTNFTERYKDRYYKMIIDSYDGIFILKRTN